MVFRHICENDFLPVAMITDELTCVISHLSTTASQVQVSLLTFANMSLKSGTMIIGSRTELLPAALLMGWIPVAPLSSGHEFSESGKRKSDLNPFLPERLSGSRACLLFQSCLTFPSAGPFFTVGRQSVHGYFICSALTWGWRMGRTMSVRVSAPQWPMCFLSAINLFLSPTVQSPSCWQYG